MSHPSHLDLQCLPSSLQFFNIIQFILKVFQNFADVILSSAFLALYGLNDILEIMPAESKDNFCKSSLFFTRLKRYRRIMKMPSLSTRR